MDLTFFTSSLVYCWLRNWQAKFLTRKFFNKSDFNFTDDETKLSVTENLLSMANGISRR